MVSQYVCVQQVIPAYWHRPEAEDQRQLDGLPQNNTESPEPMYTEGT